VSIGSFALAPEFGVHLSDFSIATYRDYWGQARTLDDYFAEVESEYGEIKNRVLDEDDPAAEPDEDEDVEDNEDNEDDENDDDDAWLAAP
jgi:hypothetical protein